MIKIINKKIQINTSLLGGSYSYISLNQQNHTIVESGEILEIVNRTMTEETLDGMIIAKPGSIIKLKNVHLKEDQDDIDEINDALADDANNNNTDKIDALKEDRPHYFFIKGLLILGGGTEEKTFSSANGQFDIPTDANGGTPLELTYGLGDHPIVMIENVKITSLGKTNEVNSVTFYQNEISDPVSVVDNGTTTTYESLIDNLEIVSSKEDGIEINGGNLVLSNVTINSSVNEYFILKNGYSGSINNIDFIVPSSQDSKLFILGSEDTNDATTTGTISGVTVDVVDTTVTFDNSDIVYSINNNYSGNIPDVTFKSNVNFVLTTGQEYEIFSSVIFEGTVNCDGATIIKGTNANSTACNITLKGNNKSFQNMTLDSCGALILDTLDSTNTISNFTNTSSPTTGLEISGGTVNVSTININSATDKYLVLSSHSGDISNSTFTLPDSTTNAIIDIQNTDTTFSGTTSINATDTNVEFDKDLNIFDIDSNYTTSNIPDIVFSTPSIFKLISGESYELFSNTTFNGTVECDDATFSRASQAKTICNVTLTGNNKAFTNMTLDSCGALILDTLDSTNTISNFTNNSSPNTGLEISNDTVQVSTLNINNATSNYLISDNHTGSISGITFDVDTNFSNINLIDLGPTTSTSTTFNDEITIKSSDTNVEFNENLNIFRVSDYDTSKTLPDIKLDNSTEFTLDSTTTEYSIFSNITFEGTVNCVNSSFTRDSDANSTCNVTLNGNSKIFSSMTLDSCGGLILDTLDSTNTISSITVNNSPSFGIKLLDGTVDIGGNNVISEDTDVEKDNNIDVNDRDYLIIDNHQNGTINSLHNIMKSTGPDASLIQFLQTSNKSSTNFTEGGYSLSGTYLRSQGQSIFSHTGRFSGTLPNLYVKSGETLNVSGNFQLMSDLITENGSTLLCDSNTFTNFTTNQNLNISGTSTFTNCSFTDLGNFTISGASTTFNNNTLTNLGIIRFNSQTGTFSDNSFDQCDELRVNGGDVNFSTLSIKDPDGQALVINDTHSGTITNLTLDLNNINDSSIINIASQDTVFSSVFIKGDFQHSGTKSVLIDRNSDTSITIPDLLIKSGDTLTLSNNITLPSNLIVQSGGILSVDDKTISKESFATGNITINTGSTSLQTTVFESCGLVKLVNFNSNTINDLTLNSCTGLQIDGGSVDITTVTINSATGDYLISDNHTGSVSGITLDVDSDFSSKKLINLGTTTLTSTTFNGEIIIKSSDSNIELNENFVIFKVSNYNESLPDVKLDNSTEFILDSTTTEYSIFSNITFEGTVNCVGSKFVRDTNANSNCNVILKGDNKIFTNMTLESCGSLILETLTTNNTISSFTNTSSPTTGLEISGGSVDISTLNINSATDKYLVLSSHSGVISDSTFTLPDSSTDAVIDIQSGTTTFSGTTTLNATGTDVQFDNNLNIFDIYSDYTSSNIPDIVFSTPSKFNLESEQSYELFSNTTFNGTVECDGATISRATGAKSICNITFENNNKTFTNMTLNSLGSLILNSLDDTNSISLTNNNSPSKGIKINNGSVDITSVTISSATEDYITSENHTGTISGITLDVDSDFSNKNLINLDSTSTTLSGDVTIKSSDTNVELNENLNIFEVSNYNETFPDVILHSTTEFTLDSSEYSIFSNITFEGSVNCGNSSFTKHSNANSICNVTLNGDNKTFTSMTLESCGALILENVSNSNSNTISSFTNNLSPDIGLQITSGSVDLDTVNIKNSTNEFIKLISHSGIISDITIDTNNSHDLSFIDIASGVGTTFDNVFIKGNFQHSGTKSVLIDRNNDNGITIPDLLVKSGDTLTISSDITLPSNLTVQSDASLNVDDKTFDKESFAKGNITINNGSSTLRTTVFDGCGIITLNGLGSNNEINNLTLNSCTELKVDGGNINIDTVTINSGTGDDYLSLSNHSGTISGITFDVDSNFSGKRLINLGKTFKNYTTLSGEITIRSTNSNVQLNEDFVIFVSSSPNNELKTFPNVKLDSSTEFTLDSTTTEYSIFSNIIFEGTVNCDGSKFVRDNNANSNCNVTLNGDNKIFTNMTLESCGSLILETLTTNNTISSFTNTSSPTTGLEISGGSVDISTLNINSATDKYLILSSHSGIISDSTFTLPDSSTDAVIDIQSGTTTFSGTTTLNATGTDVQFDNNLNIFDIYSDYTSSNIPDIVFSTPSIFNLESEQSYELFSNTTFNGTVNCDGATISRATGAKSICNITFENNNKTFTSMTLNSLGSLILNSLDDTNSISLTNNNSPSNGIKINNGSVDITSVTISSSTEDYITSENHTGTISGITLDVDSDFSNKNLINLDSTSTTLSGDVTIKSSDTNVEFNENLNIFQVSNYDTSKTLPNIKLDNSTKFKLDSAEYSIFSEISVSITNHDFESNSTISNNYVENYTPPGWTESGNTSSNNNRVFINGDNVYFNTGSNGNMVGFRFGRGLYQEFAGYTGTYTLTFDVVKRNENKIPNLSVLINDEVKFNQNITNSSVEQKTITWNNTESTIKIEFLSNDSDDKTAFIDNIAVNASITTGEYEIFSNITFEGTTNFDGVKIKKGTGANSECNVTLNGDNKTFTSMTLESCGALILENVSDSSTVTNFTNTSSPTTGLQISGGTIDVSTLNINSASSKYLVLSSHSGVISDSTFTLPESSTDAVIDIQSGSTTFSGTTSINGTDTNVEFDNNLNIFDIYSGYTSSNIPDIVFSTPSIFNLDTNTTDYKLFSNVTFEGTVNCNNATISRATGAKSICNITLKNNNKTFTNMTLDSCGALILDNLNSTNIISNFTNTSSPTTGLQISSGSVDVSTLNLNSATEDYLILDNHSGTISEITLDVDSDFSSKNLINLGSTFITSTTFSDDITITSSDENVEFNENLNIFKVSNYDTNKTLPNIKLDSSTEFKLNPNNNFSVSIINHDFETNSTISNHYVENYTPPGWTESGNTSSNNNRVFINGNNVYFNTGSNQSMVGFRFERGLYQTFEGVVDATYTLTFDVVKRNENKIPNLSVLINDEVKFNQNITNSSVEQKTVTWVNTESTVKIEFLSNDSDDKTAFIDNIVVNGSTNNNIEYNIFSNLILEGTVNCDESKFTTDSKSNSICNVTLNGDNKTFTNMTFENCGALILENVSDSNTITSFTSDSSSDIGLQITSGSVDLDTVNIKNSTNEFIKLISHSGLISDITIDTNNSHDLSFINIASGVTTTFDNVFIKGDFEHSGSKSVLIDRNNDTNITIPDLIVKSGDTLTISSDITLPSNLTVQSTANLNVNGNTFDKESYSTGNITINTGSSSLESTTFNSCGLIKLVNLDTNSTMSDLTLNSCTGLEVAGGSVDISTVTIKDASSEFLVTNDSHSGTISNLTIDTNNSHDSSFINMASGVTTNFTNVFIKGTFECTSNKDTLINRNGDSTITRPDLRVSDTLTIASDMKLSSLLIVLPGGTITAESKTFTQDSDAEGGILVLAGDGSTDAYEFDQISSLGTINYGSGGSNTISSCTLSGLGTLNKYSALTLVGLTKTNNVMKNIIVNDSKDHGISVFDGDVELCTITIKDPVYNYINTNFGHDGLVHGLTLNNTASHTYSLIEVGSGVSKEDSGVVKTAFTNVTYTNSETDTNKNVSSQNTGTVNHGDTNTTVFKVNSGAEMYLNGIKHTTSTNAFRSSFDNQISILQRGTFTITFKQNC